MSHPPPPVPWVVLHMPLGQQPPHRGQLQTSRGHPVMTGPFKSPGGLVIVSGHMGLQMMSATSTAGNGRAASARGTSCFYGHGPPQPTGLTKCCLSLSTAASHPQLNP